MHAIVANRPATQKKACSHSKVTMESCNEKVRLQIQDTIQNWQIIHTVRKPQINLRKIKI